MATTNSFSSTANFEAIDATVTRVGDFALNDFNSLSIPAGATINGIQVVMVMATLATTNGATYFKVNNGTSDSSAKAANENFTEWSTTSVITVGADDDLWGLSWTPSTCENITVKFDVNYHDGNGQGYFDSVQVIVTFTEGVATVTRNIVTLSSGNITINNGTITI